MDDARSVSTSYTEYDVVYSGEDVEGEDHRSAGDASTSVTNVSWVPPQFAAGLLPDIELSGDNATALGLRSPAAEQEQMKAGVAPAPVASEAVDLLRVPETLPQSHSPNQATLPEVSQAAAVGAAGQSVPSMPVTVQQDVAPVVISASAPAQAVAQSQRRRKRSRQPREPKSTDPSAGAAAADQRRHRHRRRRDASGSAPEATDSRDSTCESTCDTESMASECSARGDGSRVQRDASESVVMEPRAADDGTRGGKAVMAGGPDNGGVRDGPEPPPVAQVVPTEAAEQSADERRHRRRRVSRSRPPSSAKAGAEAISATDTAHRQHRRRRRAPDAAASHDTSLASAVAADGTASKQPLASSPAVAKPPPLSADTAALASSPLAPAAHADHQARSPSACSLVNDAAAGAPQRDPRHDLERDHEPSPSPVQRMPSPREVAVQHDSSRESRKSSSKKRDDSRWLDKLLDEVLLPHEPVRLASQSPHRRSPPPQMPATVKRLRRPHADPLVALESTIGASSRSQSTDDSAPSEGSADRMRRDRMAGRRPGRTGQDRIDAAVDVQAALLEELQAERRAHLKTKALLARMKQEAAVAQRALLAEQNARRELEEGSAAHGERLRALQEAVRRKTSDDEGVVAKLRKEVDTLSHGRRLLEDELRHMREQAKRKENGLSPRPPVVHTDDDYGGGPSRERELLAELNASKRERVTLAAQRDHALHELRIVHARLDKNQTLLRDAVSELHMLEQEVHARDDALGRQCAVIEGLQEKIAQQAAELKYPLPSQDEDRLRDERRPEANPRRASLKPAIRNPTTPYYVRGGGVEKPAVSFAMSPIAPPQPANEPPVAGQGRRIASHVVRVTDVRGK